MDAVVVSQYPEANRRRGGQVRVRGTCSDGHITERTSDPGRITWDGPCGKDGCDKPIHAKRVPREVRPPETPADAHTPPAESDDIDNVREVSYDQSQPRRRGAGRAGGDVPSGGDQGPPEVVDVDERTGDVQHQRPEPESGPGPGIVPVDGPELVERTPRRPEQPRRRERHVFALPWER